MWTRCVLQVCVVQVCVVQVCVVQVYGRWRIQYKRKTATARETARGGPFFNDRSVYNPIFCFIFAQESLSVTVLLKTGVSALWSLLSGQK